MLSETGGKTGMDWEDIEDGAKLCAPDCRRGSAGGGSLSAPVRFSTQVVPPQQRHLFWRDVVAETFPGMTADAPRNIRADLARWTLGAVGLARARSSQARVSRVANQDGHNILLHLQCRGRLILLHDGGVTTAGVGDIVIADDSRPYAIDISESNDCLIFQMPASRLGGDYCHGDWHGRLLPAGEPNAAFFDYMVRGLWERRDQFCDIDDAMGDVLTEAALVICRSAGYRPGAGQSKCSPVEFTLRHLAHPDLGTAMICEATGLSPRAVQKAFLRDAGMTPTTFINERRLERSAELLAGAGTRTITEIALEVGFNDPAFFSRCFRRRFGVPPRQWKVRMDGADASPPDQERPAI